MSYSAAKNDDMRCMFSCFSAMGGCTYLFIVMLTFACPRISLRLFTSKPSSIHLVAKVWRRIWKLTSSISNSFKIFLKWYCSTLGSIRWVPSVDKTNPVFRESILLNTVSRFLGIGITLFPDTDFGDVITTLVFPSFAVSSWMRWSVWCTYIVWSENEISSQRRAQTSPIRRPVSKQINMPVLWTEGLSHK